MNVKDLGSIVGIWAHPDDESFGTGGIMAIARENGQQVACITATKGELGVQNEAKWPKAELGTIRASEMVQSMRALDVASHHWLGYKDGSCHTVDSIEAVSVITALVEKYKPDTIITFSPDGMTGHLDHAAVSVWARKVGDQLGINVYYVIETQEQYKSHWADADARHNIFFNIDRPTLLPCSECDICVVLPEGILDKKIAALRAMPSQTERLFADTESDRLRHMLSVEALVRADRTDITWGNLKESYINE